MLDGLNHLRMLIKIIGNSNYFYYFGKSRRKNKKQGKKALVGKISNLKVPTVSTSLTSSAITTVPILPSVIDESTSSIVVEESATLSIKVRIKI